MSTLCSLHTHYVKYFASMDNRKLVIHHAELRLADDANGGKPWNLFVPRLYRAAIVALQERVYVGEIRGMNIVKKSEACFFF